jgi:hypothetical protein
VEAVVERKVKVHGDNGDEFAKDQPNEGRKVPEYPERMP